MTRLIDADALCAQMVEDAEQMDDPIAEMFTYAAINDVKHAPTVDAEPVRHGRWEDCSNGWMCSVCGRDSTRATDYCPHCGAKMDGEHETD